MSSLATDSLDPLLQSKKDIHANIQKAVELRTETVQLIEKSTAMVGAFFSSKALEEFQEAIQTKISILNSPNTDFEKNRVNAVIILSKELGII